MITLIKIKTKYLSNHLCSVYWSYFFITSLILVSLLIFSIEKIFLNQNSFVSEAKNKTETILSQNLTFDFNFSVVSNDEKDKEILQELIKKDINWFTKVNEVSSKYPIIKINNENEKYKIELIQNQENRIFNQSFLIYLNYISQILPKFYENNELNELNKYIRIQSLFAQFLIKKKGINYSQKELFIEFGDKSNHIINDIFIYYFIISFGFIISLHFGMTSCFFCIWMIEEKEKKLTELLERHGISNKTNFFSWLLTYLIIIIIILPLIIYILLFLQLFPNIITLLLILNMILFIISLYLLTYFLYLCISKSQNGSIIIKLIYIPSPILGLILISEKFHLGVKVIFALIPQINLILCSYSIQQLSHFKKLSWNIIRLQQNEMSYINSIIIYMAEIILFSLLLIIFTKYKQSGLDIFQFLLSFCKKVKEKLIKQ